MKYLAHSGTAENPAGQTLADHLRNVSKRAAACMTDPFLARYAALCGLYHDAGKCKPEFQRYLQGVSRDRVDHATLGGQLLSQRFSGFPKTLIAAPVFGHHGGIPNAIHPEQRRTIEERLQDPLPETVVAAFDAVIPEAASIGTPPKPQLHLTRDTLPFEMYMASRMVFSALVDADFLDTEQFYDVGQASLRGRRPPLGDLLPRYDAHMASLTARGAADIRRIRSEIHTQCLQAAEQPQGFFSLTVPTGGGKTLSSLGFALRHAQRHPNIRRVIYAIPFTSIIEQNADVFRQAVGEDAVLEHHSAVKTPEEGTPTDRASENWDAPLIVTTNVQLFESLFANKPSSCRKLHHLQDAVIILDEMQALPDAVLKPCLRALTSLVHNYRATVVICTATQPNYDRVWPSPVQVTEIMDDPEALFEAMRRTRVIPLGTLDDDALVSRLVAHEQVLCIVNNRAQAQSLCRALGGEAQGAFHLSTLMCANHRTRKLAVIRELLDNNQRVRVVSTSLIEAGVDIDFPVVFRAAAGLDAIAQAAGRCNRGGFQTEPAPVYVFSPADAKAPPETERLGNITLREVAAEHEDLLCRQAIAQYFSLRFGAGARLDEKEILRDIGAASQCAFPYESIAKRFGLIASGGEALFIPYDANAQTLIERLACGQGLGSTLRQLQRYSVSIYENQKRALLDKGYLRQMEGILVLDASSAQLSELYTEEYGLNVEAAMVAQIL